MKHLGLQIEYNKQKYDRKAKSVEIVPGDKVLVKNVRDRGGTGKLRSYWEQNIYEVVSKYQDIPVYKIKQVGDNRARTRTIHRNLLKLFNELPLELLEKPIHKGGKVRKELVLAEDNEDEVIVIVKRNEGNTQRGERRERKGTDERLVKDVDDGMGDSGPEEEIACRRSSRYRKPKKIFTYNKVGGNPVCEETK